MYRYEAEQRELMTPAAARGPRQEALRAHCDLYLGESAGVFVELVSDLVHIDLLMHEPSDLRPFWTIVTSGVSDLATAAPNEAAQYRRIELLTYLPASWPVRSWGARGSDEAWWPARMLKEVGRFVHQHRTWIAPGHTIGLGGERHTPLTPGSLLTSVILLAPLFEADSFDELSMGSTPCRFVWVCPITEAEERLTLEQDASDLFALMNQHQLPKEIDPHRACMVTGRRPRR